MMADGLEIFDSSFSALERAMRVATMKQTVIAHNIANARTPGYEPMTFDEELMRAVKRQDKKQVVIEEELNDLARNSGKYSAMTKLMASKVNILKTIASQGRR
jgi:flagellar basal body rod protein FlgB